MTVLKSLTSRLVLTTVVLVLVVSVLIGAATTLAMRSYLQDQLDDQVRQALRVQPGGGPGSEIGMLRAVLPDGGEARVEVVRPTDGGPPRQTSVEGDVAGELIDVPTDGEPHSVDLPDLGSYRVIALDADGGTFVVGLPEDDVTNTLERLISLEVLFALLATAAAAGAALVVVRRQLRPLKEVAATAHTVATLPLDSGDAAIPSACRST